jgi:hypothetical protein
MLAAEQLLIITGSAVFLVLGSLHLYYTFFSEKFDPRDPVAMAEMKKTSPRLSKETTMWRAWIGFNASHSSGAMYLGVINIVLAVFFFDSTGKSSALGFINTVTAAFYLFLARKYWFTIPFRGILIALICFVIALTLSFVQ